MNGSDSLIVSKSDVATLVAKTSASYDKEFDKWVIKAGKATIKDVNSETTTITNVDGQLQWKLFIRISALNLMLSMVRVLEVLHRVLL